VRGCISVSWLENRLAAWQPWIVTTKDYLDYLESPEFNPDIQYVFVYDPLQPTGIWKLIAKLWPAMWHRERKGRELRNLLRRAWAYREKSHEVLIRQGRIAELHRRLDYDGGLPTPPETEKPNSGTGSTPPAHES
jgi:hypothetical protein